MADANEPEEIINDNSEEPILANPNAESPQAPVEDTEEVETPEEDTEEAEPEEDESESEQPEEEEQKPPSRRKQLRIEQLLEKLEGNGSPAPKPTSPQDVLDYESELDADEDTIKRLAEDRKVYGEKMFQEAQERMAFSEFKMRLEFEAPRVETNHPELDKNSDKFKPEVAKALNTAYLSFAGFNPETGKVANPNLRYGDFIESMWELADEIGTNNVAEAATNARKAAAKTGLRPNGSGTPKLNLNKAPSAMTDEELKAAMAQMFPSK